MRQLIWVLVISGACVLPALAYDFLSAEDVKALVSGKTVEAYHEGKRADVNRYFYPDGMVDSVGFKGKGTGTWRVKDSGELCFNFGKENCGYVSKQSDGTYFWLKKRSQLAAVEPYNHIMTFKKITDGNALEQ